MSEVNDPSDKMSSTHPPIPPNCIHLELIDVLNIDTGEIVKEWWFFESPLVRAHAVSLSFLSGMIDKPRGEYEHRKHQRYVVACVARSAWMDEGVLARVAMQTAVDRSGALADRYRAAIANETAWAKWGKGRRGNDSRD